MKHSILFTGHMIDAGDRINVRFPPEKEDAVKQEIKNYLLDIKAAIKNDILGIAGGACGGDILFHELCIELNIRSEIFLALPPGIFKKKSVSFAGKGWEMRFNKLSEKLPVHVLAEAKNNSSNNIWEKANVWMLDTSLQNGGENMSLIALWDRKPGDGSGGSEHMVKVAKEKHADVHIIDMNKI